MSRASALLLCSLAAASTVAQDQPLGNRSAFDLSGETAEQIEVGAGTSLHHDPSPTSAVLTVIGEAGRLEALERRGTWVRVFYQEWSGWVDTAEAPGTDAALAAAADTGESRAAAGPPLEPDPQRLEVARQILGPRSREGRLGELELLTDSSDTELLDLLDAAATALPGEWQARYGVSLQEPAPPMTVVLFAHADDYHTFTELTAPEELFDAPGHAGQGVAALHLEGAGGPAEILPLFGHEVTHLLNRAGFGRELPPWLEEGIANDIGYSLAADGSFVAGRWGSPPGRTVTAMRGANGVPYLIADYSWRGPAAARRMVLETWKKRRLLPLAELFEAPRLAFIEPTTRTASYGQATMAVRFLLDGGNERQRDAFRAFLESVALGAPADPAALLAELGRSIEQLDEAYRKWLTTQLVIGG